MSLQAQLPELQKTILEMIAELLLVEKEKRYTSLLFGDLGDKQVSRVTMNYVMALLSYGFTPNDSELTTAAEWFDKPFPNETTEVVDAIEMNRLMTLLYLRPDRESVRARLQQLVTQRSRDGYFDIQPDWHGFDTLWALEAFTLAKQAQVLSPEIITTDEIQRCLNWLITGNDLKRDKDVALALRLQYEMFGVLENKHVQVLENLLHVADEHNGLWGMREFAWRNMKWMQALKEGRHLTYDIIKEHYVFFRKTILSTCMVIENLSPMMKDYPEVVPDIERALNIWWGQLKGQNAVAVLRGLFPNPYDYEYLMVLTRTLRALREYLQRPQVGIDALMLLRELTTIRTDTSESQEVRSLKKALRHWIQVDITGVPERLKLGYSDSNVVRVQPFVWSPLASPDDKPESFIKHSLIIKYGSSESIDAERRNYEAVPAATRDFFVRIPETTFIDPDNGQSFVIMQDLRSYKTLYEVHDVVARRSAEIGDLLGNFLVRMHEGGSSQSRSAPKTLLRDAYLSKMQEYIDRTFAFIMENPLIEWTHETEQVQYGLFECIGRIMQHQQKLEDIKAAYMHGDLHLRNVMVYGLGGDQQGHNGPIFKLIDLEFMRKDGDAAFDAGQLLIDIELVMKEERKSDQQFLKLRDSLEKRYIKFGRERDDATFETRLDLAKARALLRIAKGKTKRGSGFLKEAQYQLARQIADEVMSHAEYALEFLQKVVRAIH